MVSWLQVKSNFVIKEEWDSEQRFYGSHLPGSKRLVSSAKSTIRMYQWYEHEASAEHNAYNTMNRSL